ncbi:MAG TPA: hypothetical protein VGV17_16010 [Bosea sp. (in: a-proteobacteria)]|jgi:hypothetical protein|uniref:hypothetical protein n=1 Tax=Bosea sp. (in: a-proteobacteria) TaxID=1871050 RepID=UPI002DDD94A5|nr:hypothetical protein [Bosea sp. (in: a-proteobacteria)]HEV2555260.1 hypothetical protein [Bosea sp. (in: a-proteobacteria)]
MSDDPDALARVAFPERGWHTDPRSAAAHQRLIEINLTRAAECELASRPENGPVANKDELACDALGAAVWLLDSVAGWAARHSAGLALSNLEHPSYILPKLRADPEIKAMREAISSHEHEERGGYASVSSAAPECQRRAAMNLLRSLSTSRSMGPALAPLYDALKALEFGETLPILRPAGTGQKREYREQMLQLRALGFVAYREIIGGSKKQAQAAVADVYGVAEHTIRTWEYRLRKHPRIGRFEVARTIEFAKNSASWAVERRRNPAVPDWDIARGENCYGLPALQAAAAQYQSLLRGGE